MEPGCCYLYPSKEKPGGDLKKPCSASGEWSIWEEGTHPAEVTNGCSGHVGLLLGTTGGRMRFRVWPSEYDLSP